MSRWFRVYEDMVNDPKVQRLPAETFKGLINLWCIASANGGKLPPMSHIAFMLRMNDADACQLIVDLDEAGFLDTHEDYTCPHNWDVRQFKSDVSTERVKRHRNAKRNVSQTLQETPPETDTETDTEVATQPVASRKIEIDRLEAELREAAGQENNPSSSLLDISPITALLRAGYDLREDVLPKLRAAKASGKKPSTWAYYVRAITEGKARNDAIPAKATSPPPSVATVWLTEDDPQWPVVADRHQRERGKPLKPYGSRFRAGQGADIPADWIEPRAA